MTLPKAAKKERSKNERYDSSTTHPQSMRISAELYAHDAALLVGMTFLLLLQEKEFTLAQRRRCGYNEWAFIGPCNLFVFGFDHFTRTCTRRSEIPAMAPDVFSDMAGSEWEDMMLLAKRFSC